MKRKYISITLILLIFTQTICFTSVFAQKLKRIDEQMLKYEYAESTKLLEKIILEKGRHTQEAMEKLALCYRLMNEPEQAAKWYAEVIKDEETNPENYFYYAQMLRTLGRYVDAQRHFLKYNSLVPENTKEAVLLAQYCENIIPYLNKADTYTITNLTKLNTAYSEFSPVVYKDSLVFTSDRPSKDKHSKTYSWTGNSFLDLFASEINYSNDQHSFGVSNPVEFNKELSQSYHDGTAVFSKDWNKIFYTRTTNERVKKGNNPVATIVLKLYESHFINGHWSEPESFYLNSDLYSVGHPALSVDGKKLYFVSDMPDGFGGTDLYECTLENDQWANVKNLGSRINTSGNEMFPYVKNDGSLYFSSTGQFGYGGLDVFVTKPKGEGWQSPENLGKPINSSYDDFGISFITEGKGFVSSNRLGGYGSDDIYSFERIIIIPPIMISGRVISDQGSVLKDATIFLLNSNTNKVQILKTDNLGRYSTEVEKNTPYILLSKKINYLDDCLSVQVKEDDENPNDLVLEKLAKNKIIAIENIYYNFDKWDIKLESEIELNHVVKILKENQISIELGSHTDSRGTDKYNAILSQKRAQSAVNYIISQGIDSSIISAKGYGESKLINKCSDGISCTEDEHQMNRRTEFKIIAVKKQKENSVDSLSKYVVGEIYNINEFKTGYFDKCKEL